MRYDDITVLHNTILILSLPTSSISITYLLIFSLLESIGPIHLPRISLGVPGSGLYIRKLLSQPASFMMQMLTMKEDFIYKQIIDRIVRPTYIVTSLLNRRNKCKRKAIMIDVGTNRGSSSSGSSNISSSSSSSNNYKKQLKEEDVRIVSRNYHHLLTNSSMSLCKYPKLMSYNEDNQTDRVNVDDEMIYNTIIQSNGDDSVDINNDNFQDDYNPNRYHQHNSNSSSSSSGSSKTKNQTKSSFSSGSNNSNSNGKKKLGDTLNPSIIFATIANTYDNMSCMHINSSVTQMVTGHKDSAVRVWRMNPKDRGFFGRSLKMR